MDLTLDLGRRVCLSIKRSQWIFTRQHHKKAHQCAFCGFLVFLSTNRKKSPGREWWSGELAKIFSQKWLFGQKCLFGQIIIYQPKMPCRPKMPFPPEMHFEPEMTISPEIVFQPDMAIWQEIAFRPEMAFPPKMSFRPKIFWQIWSGFLSRNGFLQNLIKKA